jgi:anti-sigma factor RsiW
MNGHLGEQVAAFVDGQLDYPRREKALEHLSGCAGCRAAVDQERWVKARVQTLPGAEPSADLLSSLSRVQVESPMLVPPTETSGYWHFPQSRARRSGLMLASAGTVAAGFLGLAYTVGGTTVADHDPVSPPVDRFSTEFAGTESSTPFSDPAVDVFSVIGNRASPGGR